jgi:hypothetical protein
VDLQLRLHDIKQMSLILCQRFEYFTTRHCCQTIEYAKNLGQFSHKAIQVRAVIEGQFLSMKGHAERCGLPVPPKRIIATGGASSNQAILKIMASIFGCSVYTVQRPGMWMNITPMCSCPVIHIASS